MTTRPARSRAAMISSASCGERHISFSTSTCRPASSAATTLSVWYSSLLSTRTQSRGASRTMSPRSAYRRSTPYRSPASVRRVGEMSATAVTSNRCGRDSRIGRWTTWATSPRPMTPIRSGFTKVSSRWSGRAVREVRGSTVGREGGVEGGGRRLDLGQPADEGEGVGSADGPVHAGVLPLDGDRASVVDAVEHPEDRLPGHVPVAGGDEVPAPARVAPGQVRGEPAVATVQPHLRLLAVDVVDPLAEVPQEVDRVEVLPDEVARVEVEAERRPVADRLYLPLGIPVVVGDLAGVHIVGEAHADLVEDVEDRVPPVGEVRVAAVDHLGRHRREHRDRVAHRRPGEPDHRGGAERRRRARGVLDLLGSPSTDALGVTVTPDARRQDALVPLVDGVVADRLAGQVAGDGEDREAVIVDDPPAVGDVAVLGDGAVHVEV